MSPTWTNMASMRFWPLSVRVWLSSHTAELCICRYSSQGTHACIYAGVPAHAASQATILRVTCRATTFVGLQPVYVYIPEVESVSRRYVYVRTGA